MSGFFRILVDALNDDLLRTFIAQQQALMQFSRDVIHALVVAQDTLGDRLTDFSDQALHVEVLEYGADDGMCEEIGSRERKHEPRGDIRDRLIEVWRVLWKASQTLGSLLQITEHTE